MKKTPESLKCQPMVKKVTFWGGIQKRVGIGPDGQIWSNWPVWSNFGFFGFFGPGSGFDQLAGSFEDTLTHPHSVSIQQS
jgi:hypothetical protein